MRYFYGKHKVDSSFGFNITKDDQTDEVHSEFVEISENEYNDLLEKQNQGYEIKEKGGRPFAEKYVPTIEEQNEAIRSTREYLYQDRTDGLTLRKLRKQSLGTWTEEDEAEYVQLLKDISEQINAENPYIDIVD